VGAEAPFDLVLANILAGPLIEMAPDAARVTAPGGYIILSGLLARQERDVTEAHLAHKLKLEKAHALGDWRALVFAKE
jgi:ribosomal protein L11 methyltransferase